MADNSKEYKLRLVTEADTSGADDAKESLDDLGKEVDEVKESLDDLSKEAQEDREVLVFLGKEVDEVKESLDELGEEAAAAKESLDDLGKEAAAAEVEMSDLGKKAGEAAEEMGGLSESLEEVEERLGDVEEAQDEQAQSGEDAADAVRKLAGAFGLSEGAASGLIKTLKLATGPLGWLVLAVGLVIDALIKLKQKADEDHLAKLREGAESARAAMESLTAAITDQFGKALDEHSAKLDELVEKWRKSKAEMEQGFADLDADVKHRLNQDLADLGIRKEQDLLGATTDEERKEIERRYKEEEETLRSTAAFESATIKADKAAADEAKAREGLGVGAATVAAGEAQVQSADQMEADARRRLAEEGIYSDQERQIMAAEQSERRIKQSEARLEKLRASDSKDPGIWQNIGWEEEALRGLKEQHEPLEKARERAGRRRDTGAKDTYKDFSKEKEQGFVDPATGKKMQITEAGKDVFNAEMGVMDQAAELRDSGQEKIEEGRKTTTDSKKGLEQSLRDQRDARARGQLLDTQAAERDMRRAREERERGGANTGGGGASQPSPDPQLEQAAEASKQAADEVGESAQKLAVATTDSSKQIAGDMRQLTTEISRNLSLIQSTVADVTRAVAAQGQRTEQVAQMAAAAMQGVADMRAGNRPFNRR